MLVIRLKPRKRISWRRAAWSSVICKWFSPRPEPRDVRCTFMRVKSLNKTLRLWVCRTAWTTFGISFSTMGLSIGYNGCAECELSDCMEWQRSYYPIFVKLLALLLLATFKTEHLNFIRDSKS